MTKSIRFIVAAIAVIIAIFASGPAGAAPVEIAGDVTYYERIALPPAAVLQVQLLDLTLKGEPARIGAEAMIEGPGQVPLQFILSFDDDVLIAGHSYALVATIWAGEHIWFRNAAPHPIESPLSGLPVVIVVNFVGELIYGGKQEAADADAAPPDVAILAPVEPAELEVSAEIFDTIWVVLSITGRAPADGVQLTLSITTDRRAGGIGGCNNYFAEAFFDGPALSFGDIVSTRMGCADKVMDQESAYFAALTSVRGYEIDKGSLYLLDADGNQLLSLTRMDVN